MMVAVTVGLTAASSRQQSAYEGIPTRPGHIFNEMQVAFNLAACNLVYTGDTVGNGVTER